MDILDRGSWPDLTEVPCDTLCGPEFTFTQFNSWYLDMINITPELLMITVLLGVQAYLYIYKSTFSFYTMWAKPPQMVLPQPYHITQSILTWTWSKIRKLQTAKPFPSPVSPTIVMLPSVFVGHSELTIKMSKFFNTSVALHERCRFILL